MKRICFFLLLSFQIGTSQVGINTTSPNAQLEIRSSDQAAPSNTDGLLIPKVDAFPASNPTAAQQGMMVYLTTTSGTNLPGFYYWDNLTTTWVGVGKNTANAWALSGNAGTSAATHFLGTTDNQDLVFKRNSIFSGRIANGNTFLGQSAGQTTTGNFNTFMGTSAGSAITTGSENVFIGRLAGANGTTATDNVLIGNAAGLTNAANDNVMIGAFSGNSNTSGANNIFLGSLAGSSNSSGSNNLFFGRNTGINNSTGSFNTLVGTQANTATNNLVNAAAIGANAVVAASNSMVLGSISGVNSATASTAVVIGATTPTAALEVTATNRGVLIPRVVLLATNIQAPVANPNGGSLPESTLVYNTVTAGVSPNNVYPGFYYWDSSRWVRFDVNGENNPKYYTAVGTNDISSPISFGNMAQMNLTFTPKDDVALVNFSAAGRRSDDGCQNNAIFFQLLLNGVPVTGWQTASKQGIVDIPFLTDDVTVWDTNFTYPVAVTIGVPQTIQVQWASPNCAMLNAPATPLTAFGATFKSYRSLTVIDPNGGGGIVGSPPVTTNQWALNGNSGTNASTHFVGTSDPQSLVLKSNNIEGIRIGTNGNVGVGTVLPLDKLHVTGNIRMVDGNQAAGKILTSDANGTATWQTPAATDWSLNGNSGTSAATNFIGTTDNVDLVFKRNNTFSGRIGETNTFLGKDSGAVNTANYNTFLGQGAGAANATGNDNTFVGRLAGANGTTGNDNSYLGYAAGLNNTGNSNLILGAFASQNSSGNFNVIVGNQSGGNNTTGTRNTLLGFNAEVGAGGLSNATAIGNLAQVNTSNSLVLGSINGVNGATASTNVGIGTSTPLRTLHVATGTSGATPLGSADIVLESNGPTYQHFLTPSTSETGILFGSNLNTIYSGIIANNTGNTLGLQFRTGGNTTRMTITSAGDIGIGTAAPGGQFQLSLDEGRKPGTNTWTIVSDARLKNVSGTYDKGLEEIIKLRPVRYHYKNVGEKQFEPEVLSQEFSGFLAQEVREVFPEAVGTDRDGYLNFNMHSILVASVNALKELDAKNNQLEKENEALKKQLSEHEQKLDYLLSEIEKIKNR